MGRVLWFGWLGAVAGVVLIAVLAALTGWGAGTATPPAVPDEPADEPAGRPWPTEVPAPRPGVPIAAGAWEYVVEPARREGPLRSGAPPGPPDEAKGQWVVVGVTLTNRSPRSVGLNAQDFELRTAGAVTYHPASGGAAAEQWAKEHGFRQGVLSPVGTGPLPPGVPVRYAVLYDINPADAGLRLYLTQARVAVPVE